MAKGKKNMKSEFVNIRISREAYEVAKAGVPKLQEEVSKANGVRVQLRPSAVIEKMLLKR